jgi:hypothetical protein
MRPTALLRAPSRLFKTALVTVPLPPPLQAELQQLVPNVLYRPYQGPDRVVDAPLPTPKDYAQADALFTWEVPKELAKVEQTPRLKLFQGYKTGYDNITASNFYKSVPEESDLTFASLSGIVACVFSRFLSLFP